MIGTLGLGDLDTGLLCIVFAVGLVAGTGWGYAAGLGAAYKQIGKGRNA